jgi:hypothetical protein
MKKNGLVKARNLPFDQWVELMLSDDFRLLDVSKCFPDDSIAEEFIYRAQ